jgi:hypothetical protein
MSTRRCVVIFDLNGTLTHRDSYLAYLEDPHPPPSASAAHTATSIDGAEVCVTPNKYYLN